MNWRIDIYDRVDRNLTATEPQVRLVDSVQEDEVGIIVASNGVVLVRVCAENKSAPLPRYGSARCTVGITTQRVVAERREVDLAVWRPQHLQCSVLTINARGSRTNVDVRTLQLENGTRVNDRGHALGNIEVSTISQRGTNIVDTDQVSRCVIRRQHITVCAAVSDNSQKTRSGKQTGRIRNIKRGGVRQINKPSGVRRRTGQK